MDSVGNIILYFVVAAVMTIFSVMAVTSRKILRAATYLLFVLLSTAVFYFQLGFQFLGGVQIAVYAGGIMVLFVFSILLTHKPNDKSGKLESHRLVMGVSAGIVGAALLLFALLTMPMAGGESLAQCIAAGPEFDMKTLGHTLLGTEKYHYLLPFEAVSVLLLACIVGAVVVARKR